MFFIKLKNTLFLVYSINDYYALVIISSSMYFVQGLFGN